uniref:ShKT domain-containing protein n=1 Tax=Ornithorhynchus anatinus TaxID=9258 RepID=A0A6I8NGR6_ORNAN
MHVPIHSCFISPRNGILKQPQMHRFGPKKCKMATSSTRDRTVGETTCGENTLESNYTTSWNDTIFFWQKEQLSFKYGLGVIKPYSEIASYTQMIWYSSYEIGCGVAYCPSSLYKYFYVCHYCPAGNNQDMLAFPYKAGAPCADCWKNCHHGLCTNACKRSDKFSNCVALKEKLTCNFPAVRENCKASCQCSSDIK